MINDVWHNAYKMYSNGEGIICLLLYSQEKCDITTIYNVFFF